MKEILIIKTDQGEKIKSFLNKEGVFYETYQDPHNSEKENIFANYDQAIKDQEREQELSLWDNVDLDEKLNKDGEW
jgi:cupin superfamily acireductone dioxygenase involved in methionine salvage